MVEGRRRSLEKLKAEGKPVPWGRKKGGVNRSAAERFELARWLKPFLEQLGHKARRRMSAE
jgi:hypothetical protein